MMATHFICVFCQKPLFVQSADNLGDDLAKFENHMVEIHEALYDTELLFWACLAGERERGQIARTKIARSIQTSTGEPSKDVRNQVTWNEQNEAKQEDAWTEECKEGVDHPVEKFQAVGKENPVEEKMCSICNQMFPASSVFQHMNKCYTSNQTTQSNTFDCDQCDKVLNCIGTLNQHLKTQHQNKSYTCSFCERKLRNSYSLEKHILEFHLGNANLTEKNRFPCSICQRHFTRPWCLDQHMKKHTKREHMTCETCKIVKYSLREFEVHISKQTFCELCQLKICRKKDVLDHQLTHQGSSELKCGICGKDFLIKANLRDHEQSHQSDSLAKVFRCTQCIKMFKTAMAANSCWKKHAGLFKCNLCGRRLLGPAELKRHQETHDDTRDFPCTECKISLVSEKALKKHRKLHIDGKPFFPCEECGHHLKSFDSLHHHMKYNHPNIFYKCNFCDFTTRTFERIGKHEKYLHEKELGLDGVKPRRATEINDLSRLDRGRTFKRSFKKNAVTDADCLICMKKFRSKHYLSVHMRIHKGQKDFQCPKCPMKSSRIYVIRSHCTKIHKLTKSRLIEEGLYRCIPKDTSEPQSFSCDRCEYKTQEKTYLPTHMRKHTGERPFGCSQCPKRFTRKTLAKSHLVKGHIMESEERSFLCPVCNISCSSEKALARHISTYDIAGSSFQCNECKHHLKCAVSLNRHMKWHHPTKPSKCNSCNFVSKTIRGLRNHKRKSHPKELKQEKATY